MVVKAIERAFPVHVPASGPSWKSEYVYPSTIWSSHFWEVLRAILRLLRIQGLPLGTDLLIRKHSFMVVSTAPEAQAYAWSASVGELAPQKHSFDRQ